MRAWHLILMLLFVPLLEASAQSQARDFLRRVPEVVEPAPHGAVRMRVDGARINFPVDPDELRQSLSAPLSEACSRLEFNQVKQGRFYMIIDVPDLGPYRYGYAQGDGLNLKDPRTLREPGIAYLFDLDGTSECRVYAYKIP